MCVAKIKNIFHKIRVHFKRRNAVAIPYEGSMKQYGNESEDEVFIKLKNNLSKDAVIFQNVCLNKKEAKGDIDFLVIYQNKVFVIELKSWKGRIKQEGDNFIQEKDSYNDTFLKIHSSPIKQINQSVFILKKEFHDIWFQKVLLFLNAESVSISDDFPCFLNVNELIDYIVHNGEDNSRASIEHLKANIVTYDTLFSYNLFNDKECKCLIEPQSLCFHIDNEIIKKNDISKIVITHKYASDELKIKLKNNKEKIINIENGELKYLLNGVINTVAFSKLDCIII